jgi:hypothetical protein
MTKLEVGTHVMCKWRDNQYRKIFLFLVLKKLLDKCEVLEYRETKDSSPEYYVHYVECKLKTVYSLLIVKLTVVLMNGYQKRNLTYRLRKEKKKRRRKLHHQQEPNLTER